MTHNYYVNQDCIHFSGYSPCRAHKTGAAHCCECSEYAVADLRICILKVGQAGEVLRCTPLLRRLREVFPRSEITWITSFPDFVPKTAVDRVLTYSWTTSLRLQAESFDLLLNLDKDFDVCALAKLIPAKEKRGFGLNRLGKVAPLNPEAEHKWLTGIWDDVMRANTKNYVQEIFELCGFEWRGESYLLDGVVTSNERRGTAPIVGLNTGAGDTWTTRIWPEAFWCELVSLLQRKRFDIILLGGPLEDETNSDISRKTGARYDGVVSYKEFFQLVATTDIMVTAVTMALHVAIALRRPVILFNNIFSRHEFYLYENGEILEPGITCQGCYKKRFDAECITDNCMALIYPERVLAAVERFFLRGEHGQSHSIRRPDRPLR